MRRAVGKWTVSLRYGHLLSMGRESSLLGRPAGSRSSLFSHRSQVPFASFHSLVVDHCVLFLQWGVRVFPYYGTGYQVNHFRFLSRIGVSGESRPFHYASGTCFPRGGSRASSAAPAGSRSFLYSRWSQVPFAPFHSLVVQYCVLFLHWGVRYFSYLKDKTPV